MSRYSNSNLIVVPTTDVVKPSSVITTPQNSTDKNATICEDVQIKHNICEPSGNASTQVIPNVPTNDSTAPVPLISEGNIINPSENSDEIQTTEMCRDTGNESKFRPISKHCSSLENIRSMKTNSWASKYLQSIGQDGFSPAKPSSGFIATPNHESNKIKINFLPRMKTPIGTNESTNNCSPSSVETQTKLATLANVEPQQEDMTQDVRNIKVSAPVKIIDTSNTLAETMSKNSPQPLSKQNQHSNPTEHDVVQPGSTLISGNIHTDENERVEQAMNHYHGLDTVFTNKKKTTEHICPGTKELLAEYEDDVASYSEHQNSNTHITSSVMRQTKLNTEKLIYYKDKFGTDIYKTKGLQISENNRKRRASPDSNNKERKEPNSQKTVKKPKRRSSDYLQSNDNPELNEIKCKKESYSQTQDTNSITRHIQEMHNRQESRAKSVSPVRSVDKANENSPKHPRIEYPKDSSPNTEHRDLLNFDLRSKLRNKYAIYSKTPSDPLYGKPRENLRITIQRSDDENLNTNPTPEINSIPKTKSKKIKKIKLVINVVCKDKGDSSSSSSDESDSDTIIKTNRSDLSFLDDFNIDEIVNSLTRSPENNSNPKLTEQPRNLTNTDVVKNLNKKTSSNKFVQPIIIKKEVKTEDVVQEPSVKMADKIGFEAALEPFEVNLASDIQSATVVSKLQKESNFNNQNNDFKNKPINEQTDIINNVKQEKPTDEYLSNNVKTNENTVNLSLPNESCTILTKIEGVIQEKSDINSNINVKEPIYVSNTTEVFTPESTVKIDINQSMTNKIVDVKQDITLKPSNGNENDVEIINGNISFIDLTINEPQVTEEEVMEINLTDENVAYKENANTIKTGAYLNQEKLYERTVCKEELFKITPDEEYPNKEENNNKVNEKENNFPEIHQEINSNQNKNMILPDKDNNNDTKSCEGPCHEKQRAESLTMEEMNNEIKSSHDAHNETKSDESEANENTLGKEVTKEVPKQVENQMADSSKKLQDKENYIIKEKVVQTQNISTDEGKETLMKINQKDIEPTGEKKITAKQIGNQNEKLTKQPKGGNHKKNTTNKENNTRTKTKDAEEKPHKLNITKGPNVDTKSDSKVNTTEEGKLINDRSLEISIQNRIFTYMKKKITVLSIIKHGKYSKIFRCKEEGGKFYAVKVTNESTHSSKILRGIQKEKMIMDLQKEIPKVNLRTVFLINGFALNRSWCFLMEYYPLNLSEALLHMECPFNISEVQNLAGQLVSAVLLLRSNNIIHADITPNHILLDSTLKNLKLCGFDQSYYAHSLIDLVPNIGSLSYRAPEVIVGYSASFTIDVWSTAVVIYEMVTNRKLFRGPYNNYVLYQQLCFSGNMPMDMIANSLYASNHFNGSQFMMRYGYMGQEVKYLSNFRKSTHLLYRNLWNFYNNKRTFAEQEKLGDRPKVESLARLLGRMLEIDPRERITIEFVYAEPFIYETFATNIHFMNI